MNPGLDGDFISELIRPLRRLAEAERLWRPVEHRRGVELMAQGGVAEHIFVLERGLVKLAYATTDGGERVKSFIADRGMFGPSIGDEEGRYSAITLEPSVVCGLPLRWLSAQIALSDELKAAQASFDRWVRARKEARELALLCGSAEQRYRDLLLREPNLVARLSQGDIARYIGVTPIAFSRIKRRL